MTNINVTNQDQGEAHKQEQPVEQKEIKKTPPVFAAKREKSTSQEDSSLMKTLDKVISGTLYLLVFLLPLFFVFNLVPSAWELNKQALLFILLTIGYFAWVGKMALTDKISFRKSFLIIPILTFLAIFGLSTTFSVYAEQSLWGDFGSEGRSFATVLFLVALFFLVFNNVKSIKQANNLLLTLVFSGGIAVIFSIFQLFGIFLIPIESLKNPLLNPVGSPYFLAVFLGCLFIITFCLLSDKGSTAIKFILGVLCLLFFVLLVMISLRIVWIALIVFMAFTLGIKVVQSKKSKSKTTLVAMFLLVFFVVLAFWNRSVSPAALPAEVHLNTGTSFKTAFSAWKDKALLGYGPTNYNLVFQKHKPAELAQMGGVEFDQSSSFVTTIIAETGVLGTFAFVFLVFSVLILVYKKVFPALISTNNKTLLAASGGWLYLSIILFAYLSNITVLFLWWFLLALLAFLSTLIKDPSSKKAEPFLANPRSSLLVSFALVVMLVAFVAISFKFGQKYISAAYFGKALVADAKGEGIEKIEEKLARAIALDSKRDIYYRNLALVYFTGANKRAAEKGEDLQTEDSNYIGEMIKFSLNTAAVATDLNAKNSKNWTSLAGLYEGVIGIMDKAGEKALENYQKALEMEPNNPFIYHKMANVNVVLADIEMMKAAQKQSQSQAQGQEGQEMEIPEGAKQQLAMAKENLQKTIELKPDFFQAHLLLSDVYERENDLDKAIEKTTENKAMYPAPEIIFKLGVLWYKKDDLENAKKEFEQAVSLNEEYSNARYFLGLVLDKQENKQAAKEQFEKIAELNPENEHIQKILENLNNNKEALAGLTGENPPVEEAPQEEESDEETILESPEEPTVAPESEVEDEEEESDE